MKYWTDGEYIYLGPGRSGKLVQVDQGRNIRIAKFEPGVGEFAKAGIIAALNAGSKP